MKTGIIFGVFDLFHQGHYNALLECSKQCDLLFVGILRDEAVQKYKRKPVWDQNKRMKTVLKLPFVENAIITDREIIFDKEIDVFFVSEDYKGKKLFCVPEHRYKDIIWIPYTKGISTTDLINQVNAIKCPICNKDLGVGSYVDINTIGWVCSHKGFDIKIYKENNSLNIGENNEKF